MYNKLPRLIISLILALGMFIGDGLVRGVVPASADNIITIVDNLGTATPSTQFSTSSGIRGLSIFSLQNVGPGFTLTEPTIITEIGGFVEQCSLVAGRQQCPALPFVVQIRPSTNNGVPDPSTVLASFPLPRDYDPSVTTYESVSINLLLQPGSYFALFAPQGNYTGFGFLLASAGAPFNYEAGWTPMGFLDSTNGTSDAFEERGAVRILGTLPAVVITVPIDIKPGNAANRIEIEPLDDNSVQVAVLSTAQFNAPQQVDNSSLTFGRTGDENSLKRKEDSQSPDCRTRDISSDGLPDLVCKFRVGATGFQLGDTTGILKGKTVDGKSLEGQDSVVIVLED